MPTLVNSKGEQFDVSDVDAAKMSQADPTLKIVGDVAYSPEQADAAPVSMDADKLSLAGKAAATAGEESAYDRRQYLRGKTSTIGSTIRGGLGGLSFGVTDKAFDPETIEADQAWHPVARGAGELLGAIAPAFVGDEAGLLGLAKDPVAAEQAAGALSSKMLYAGEAGAEAGSAAKLAEKGLLRGRAALEDSTQAAADLSSLDAKGLRAAKESELADIEASRVPQRQALADDLAAFRSESKDQKLWLATQGSEDAEIRAIGKRTLKADRQLDSLLDNPKRLAEKPELAKAALQQQEAALETLIGKGDSLKETFAADETGTRMAAFENAGKALERNRELQARMAELVAAPKSARLDAIADAADVLAQPAAPKSLAEDMLGGTIMGHVSGALSGLPIIGPAIGAKAGRFVSDLVFGRMKGAIGAAAERSGKAVEAFLGRAPTAAPTASVAAARVLSNVRFGAGEELVGKSLPELFKARSEEIRSKTAYDATGTPRMRPEAREEMANRLSPLRAVSPKFADQMETIGARRLEFLASKLPRRPDLARVPTGGKDTWQPADMAMRQWARYVSAVEDPHGVEERLAAGSITPEDAEAYRAVYPERYAALQHQIVSQLPTLRKQLPYAKRLALSIFMNVPVDLAMAPNIMAVLQGQFAAEPGSQGGTQAPAAQPQFGSVSKSLDKPTPAQARESV